MNFLSTLKKKDKWKKEPLAIQTILRVSCLVRVVIVVVVVLVICYLHLPNLAFVFFYYKCLELFFLYSSSPWSSIRRTSGVHSRSFYLLLDNFSCSSVPFSIVHALILLLSFIVIVHIFSSSCADLKKNQSSRDKKIEKDILRSAEAWSCDRERDWTLQPCSMSKGHAEQTCTFPRFLSFYSLSEHWMIWAQQ